MEVDVAIFCADERTDLQRSDIYHAGHRIEPLTFILDRLRLLRHFTNHSLFSNQSPVTMKLPENINVSEVEEAIEYSSRQLTDYVPKQSSCTKGVRRNHSILLMPQSSHLYLQCFHGAES